MVDCVEELHTQHYRGKWHGFGPIFDHERVLFAVFEKTKRDGILLIANSFDSQSLARCEQSIARVSYLTRNQFDLHVAGATTSKKGSLVGVALVDVSRLRALCARIETPVAVHVRSLCVIDRVEPGDYDAHATIGYSKASAPDGIGETRLGKLRSRIRMDLANAFSDIIDPNDHQWPSRPQVLIQRIASIVRVAKLMPRSAGSAASRRS